MPDEQTIAAVVTPAGEGAIGVIRLSGAEAFDIGRAFFRPTKDVEWSTVAGYTCHFGAVLDDGLGAIDQVVLTLFRAPHSYTGENVVEIPAHGSPFVLQKILSLCLAHGARLAEPGEFTQRAFLNGKLDLTQAEAVAELIRARTAQSHRAAIGQLEGHLTQAVRRLRDAILPLLAHIEVGLDHSDEDHDFLPRDLVVERCGEVHHQIAAILSSARVSKILREGLRVAFAGRPNVGKSSLLNALLKEDCAIVTPIAGTTRDTLEETVNWDGIPVVLTGTAGLRTETMDPVERLGIARSRQAIERADLVIGLFDVSEALNAEDEDVIRRCADRPHFWVMNKIDLAPRWPAEELAKRNGNAAVLAVSAKTGAGVSELVAVVKRHALQDSASAGGARWLLNSRHQEALRRADQALERAAGSAKNNHFEECVALELKTALTAMGEIIGETTTEDLLDEIFAKFCIGK